MFNLSFLNSSVLIASFAALIPLLIYLFAKKRPPKIIFSSIRFIQMSQKKQKKKVNITNLLLLIIRMLIILLTVLAIARPAVKLENLRSKTTHPPTAIAIIIDNSYSMDYVVDTQTLLEKALEKAESIRSMLTGDDISCVFTLDSQWNNMNAVLNYGAFRSETLRSISHINQTEDFSEVFVEAENTLIESHLPNREIYFITDLQERELPNELNTPLFVIPAAEINERGNLTIESAGIAENFIERGIQRQLDFQVVNYSNSPVKDVICSLYMDGKTIAEKVTDLEKREKQWNSFVIPIETSGWHTGSVIVRDERLLYDNQYYFSFYYEQNPRIAVITTAKELSPALKTVLSIYSANPDNIELIPDELTVERLAGYTNLIVWNYNSWDTRSSFIFRNLAENGVNALYLTDQNSSQSYQNFIQEEFNMRFKEYLAADKSVKLTSINSYHPVAGELAENRPAELRDLWKTDAASGVVLLAEENPVVLENNGSLLWLFDVSSLKSPFLVDANFPVLAHNSLSYTASAGGKKQFITGALIQPDDDILYLPDGEKINSGRRRLSLNQTGLYMEGTNKTPLAVNLDYAESDFRQIEKLESSQLTWCDSNWQSTIFEARYGFELWKYILMAVLLLFLLEIFIVKREEKKAQ